MTHLDPDPRYVPEPLTQADIMAMSDEEFGRFVRDIGLDIETRYLEPSRRPYRLAGLVLMAGSALVVALLVALLLALLWGWRP